MRFVYIAGPYTSLTRNRGLGADAYHDIERNIAKAREAAAWLANHGIGFFCPHLNSDHFEVITPDVPADYWYEMDLQFLKACDAILLLPGWEDSKGSCAERDLAVERGMRLFYFNRAMQLDELEQWGKELPD